MINLGLDTRKEILARALMLESLTSIFIGGLLGIKDTKNSRTLGNKSSSLSFNQKVDLLIDLGALSSENKKKFQAFMEIRNQFMHNLEAASYTECFSYLSGTDKLLLKLYPEQDELSEENKLRNASIKLADEILTITAQLMESVKQKLRQDVEADTTIKSNEAFLDSIKQTKEMLNQIIEKLIADNENISTKKLKGLGEYVSKLMYANWHKKFKELVK